MTGLTLIGLFLMARMQPKVDSAKAAGIEDFNFPTAAERPIQVVFGTRKMTSPNVTWYGDLKTREIVTKTKTLFRTTKTVTGHDYYLGMQLGLCHGPDVLLNKVIYGEETVFDSSIGVAQGEYTTDRGTIDFYDGSFNQKASDYLQSLGLEVSRLKGLSHLILRNFHIGSSENPSQVSVELSRFPKAPRPTLFTNGFTGSANERIGLDANPAFVIYELLTDKRYGASIPKNLIDPHSFLQVGARLFNEKFGLSLILDSPATAGQVITEILKVIQGNLVDDPVTGKICLRLVRNDYKLEDALQLDVSNIKSVSNYTAGSLDTAVNEVRIKYLDREYGYQERTAIAQNNALRISKGDVESRTISFPQISSGLVASSVAQRELVALSAPVKSCSVEGLRVFSDVLIGDVVNLTWEPLGIKDQIMRVTGVSVGAMKSGSIVLNLTQDVYGIFSSVYSDGSERAWVKPKITAENVISYELIDAPAMLADGQTDAVLLLAENPGNAMDFELLVKDPDDSTYLSVGTRNFCKRFVIKESLSAGYYSNARVQIAGDTMGLEAYSEAEGLQGMGLYLISSAAGREWIYAKGIEIVDSSTAYLLEVKRGLFNTPALDHPFDSKIWAAGDMSVTVDMNYVEGNWLRFKMLTRTATGKLKEADAAIAQYFYAGANLKPWRPGMLRVNGAPDGGLIVGEATFTWRTRDGSSTKIVHQEQNYSQLTESTYQVTVSDENGFLWREDVSAEAFVFSNERELRETSYLENGQLIIVPGEYAPELTFTIVAKQGGASSVVQTIRVIR